MNISPVPICLQANSSVKRKYTSNEEDFGTLDSNSYSIRIPF